MQRRSATQGFTLLETLVALTVLGFLVVALAHGTRTGLSLWNAQSRRIAAAAELGTATRVLREILTTIPVRPASLSAPESFGFQGGSDRLQLVGYLPNGLGTTRLVDMTIRLSAHRVVVAWTPHRHAAPGAPPPAVETTELMGGVEDLEFAYWGSAGDAPASWLALWEGPSLPQLIRVRVRFGDRRSWPDLIAAPQLWSPES